MLAVHIARYALVEMALDVCPHQLQNCQTV